MRRERAETLHWCQEWDSAMSTGTRSTTKLEEQMVAWMARMEQGQQNMQAGLSGQIKDLSQQFAQQAERLDGVVSKQKETERQITSLQGDLYAVKDLVDSRLRTTEEAVTGLATAQNALRERQMSLREELREELQSELREELQSELREKLAAAAATAGDPGSTLSPTARPFVPGSEPEEGRAAYGHVQRAAPYDGKNAWDAYHTQFELLAGVNRWSNTEKATYLAVSLRGPAATVLTNLPPEQRCDYRALTAALESRFGSMHQTELNRAKLKARVRQRDEGLPELAEDVERLARLAYPDAPASMIEVLAKDQFVDSLPEEDMRLRIRQSRPKTMREALETALELESYQLASKQRSRTVREARLEEGSYQEQLQNTHNTGAGKLPGDVVQQLVEALERLIGSSREQSSPRRERGQLGWSNVVCWNCNRRGHFRRHCKHKQQRDNNTPQGADASGSRQGNGQ